MLRRVVFALLLVPFFSGCSRDEGEAVPADALLIGGRTASADDFPATVRLTFSFGACGAAKIGERRFLTAAHCVTVGEVVAGSGILLRPPGRSESIPVTVVAEQHTDWNEGAEEYADALELSSKMGLDLAVLDLREDTPEIAIATVDNTPLAVGEQVVVSGAGCVSDANSPLPSQGAQRGELRFGVVPVETIAMYHHYLARHEADGREARVCAGDSGTPVYRRSADGRHVTIVGVSSFKAPSMGVWSAVVRLDDRLPASSLAWLRAADLLRGVE